MSSQTPNCNFELCNDLSCNNYCATGVFYVSLTTFRNIFKFETTEISGNQLPSAVFSDASANITYYVNSSQFPTINAAHSMMDVSGSEGIIYETNSRSSNLLKHDYIFYLANEYFNNPRMVGLYNNIGNLKINLEELGWTLKNETEEAFSIADNSGNGLTNSTSDNTNLTKRMLEQINYHASDRLQTDTSGNNKIRDISGVQSAPLIEGDSISYYWTIKSTNFTDRIYRIKLHLTDNSELVNTIPNDSVVTQTPPHSYITSTGVP